jgi:hypothetical protein
MVVLGPVQHLIGVDNVEVGHEQHLGEEDGVESRECSRLSCPRGRSKSCCWLLSPGADRDLNTQGVENIVEYLGIQRQGDILRLYFLLNIMFH